MYRFFIERPIFSTVIALVMTLSGAVCAWILPIAQYPSIVPPTVQVTATYNGADAATESWRVADLYRQVAGGERPAADPELVARLVARAREATATW